MAPARLDAPQCPRLLANAPGREEVVQLSSALKAITCPARLQRRRAVGRPRVRVQLW
jgi:hypothetical protein